jgi:hypothetical protein
MCCKKDLKISKKGLVVVEKNVTFAPAMGGDIDF